MSTNSLFIFKCLAFFVAGLCLFAVAVDINIEQMYFMAATMLVAPFVAGLVGWVLLHGLKADRRLPATCVEGEQVPVEITVTNTGLLPKFFMKVTDRLPSWLEFDSTDGNVLLQIDPRESRSIVYSLNTQKRGVFTIGPTVVSATDPFGLFTFASLIKINSELVVYPSALPLLSSLVQPGAYGWRGDEDGLRRGSGADFHGVREYQRGDDLRRVHWRTTARTGKLAVAEYTQGETLDILLALDLNAEAYRNTGTGTESAIEYAVKIAATLCEDLTRNAHNIRMLTSNLAPGDPLPSNAGKWTAPMLEILARAEATSSQTLASALAAQRSQVGRGSMLIYFTPDVAAVGLAEVLAEFQRLGATVAGFGFDRASFSVIPPRLAFAAAPGERPEAALAFGQVRTIRRGDDLAEAVHDLFGGNRRGRGPVARPAGGSA